MSDTTAPLTARHIGRLGFLRDRLATLMTNAALVGGGLVTSIAISRLLGPAGRGDYVTWQTWASAIGMATLAGLPQVVVLDDWSERRHRLGDLVVPLAVTASAGGALVAAAGVSMSDGGGALLGMLLVVATTQAGAVAAAEAQRVGRMSGEFNVVRLLPSGTALITIGALAAAGERSPVTWLVAIAAAQACVLAASLLWVTRPLRLRPSSSGGWRKTLAVSARWGPGAWVTMLQYRLDLLAVSLIFPSTVVGYYAVGVAVQAAVAAVGQVGGQHWFARRGGGTEPASLRRELLRTVGVAALCGAVIGLTAVWWLPALYGSAFAPALPLVLGMCASAVIQSADYLLAHELLLLGQGARVWMFRLPAGIFLLGGFAAVAALDLGAPAAVVLSGLGYAISATVMAVVAHRRRRRNPEVEPTRLIEEPASAVAAP